MLTQLHKLTAVERLEQYVHFLKNKKKYTAEERALLEAFFEEEEDG